MHDLIPTFYSFIEPYSQIFWDLSFWLGIFSIFAMTLKYHENSAKNAQNFTLGHKETFWHNETLCELTYPFLQALLFAPIIAGGAIWLTTTIFKPYFPHQIFQDALVACPIWAQALLGATVLDISLYIRHRFVHHYCWPFHAVHHSAKKISWTTADRLHPVDSFVMTMIDTFVLYVIGFSVEGMAFAMVIKGFFNRFNHSNLVLDYGFPLRYILVSPNMHRWHHATTKDAYNKNYTIIFAWIDVVMGTFYVPKNQVPEKYGAGFEAKTFFKNPNYIDDFVYPFRMMAHNWKKKQKQQTEQTAPAVKEN